MKYYIDINGKESLNLLKETIAYSKEYNEIRNGKYFLNSPCKYCDIYCCSYFKGKDEKGEYVEVNKCSDTCMGNSKID